VAPNREGIRGEYYCALEIQRIVERKLRASGDELESDELASLVRAWDTLREAKRILRNKPLPGSLKPEQPKPKAKLPLSIVPPTD
jgi:hypothetical protein